MNNLIKANQKETMSSVELAELLGIEKKEVNRKIRDMFAAEIEGGIIPLTFRRFCRKVTLGICFPQHLTVKKGLITSPLADTPLHHIQKD